MRRWTIVILLPQPIIAVVSHHTIEFNKWPVNAVGSPGLEGLTNRMEVQCSISKLQDSFNIVEVYMDVSDSVPALLGNMLSLPNYHSQLRYSPVAIITYSCFSISIFYYLQYKLLSFFNLSINYPSVRHCGPGTTASNSGLRFDTRRGRNFF